MSPGQGICQENKRLRDALIETVREVMQLQNEEFAALARGEQLAGYDRALEQLRLKRDRIREEIRLYISNHGCG